jgi:glyoxylase-like metal-dependent hydrolase (beta-lactamase superfamily II)
VVGRDVEIVRLDLRVANVFAVRGERTILVDTGMAGMGKRILGGLGKLGVKAAEIGLIVITHIHPDHAGSAAELQETLGVKVAVPRLEAAWLRRGRTEGKPMPARPFGHLLKMMVKPGFPACEPDILLDEGQRLDQHGVEGRVLYTPGHSPGSLSFLFANGECIAGDLIAGGFVRQNRPDYSFFIDDREETHRSLKRLLDAAPQRLHFGHGQSADAASVRRRFAGALARVPRIEDEAPPRTGENRTSGNRRRGRGKTRARR